MRAVYLMTLGVGVLLSGSVPASRGDPPAAARETIEAFEKEAAEVQKKVEEDTKKVREKTVAQLKQLQDKFCKDAMLDEAIAIRDQIRHCQAGSPNPRAADLPAAAKEILEAGDKEAVEVRKKTEEGVKKSVEKLTAELKVLQDKFCKDAKLDEALAVRDLIRRLQMGGMKAQPDPGYLSAQAADIGKVWYFEVVGNTQGSTWGSDIYTTDSHLAASAVHAGVLGMGQKGIVKVTILPGQDSYTSTTRNGVTSSSWGHWGVSFKVERVFGAPLVVPKD